MSLAGRAHEIEVLERAVGDAAEGGVRVVALAGEAGIGKSALLDHAMDAARARGMLVLDGRGAEHEREVPFGLVVDALDDVVAAMHPARLATAGPELAAVLPAAARDDVAPVALGGPAERFRYHRALRGLLELLGRERPVLLALDDVHWADEASFELLLHVLRRPPRVGFALVVALRPSAALTRLRDAGRRAPGWTELVPAPLERDAALAVVGDALPAAARERVLRDAAGNPLFLRELARAGSGGGDGAGLPEVLRAIVARELEAVSEPARVLAAGAAVAGDPFELDVAIAAAGLDEPAALDALDELVAAGIVRESGLRFRHPLVHRAVADAAPPGWRLRAHARADAALAARGAAPAQRAHHVERSAQPGDDEAIAVLEAAARAVEDTAPATAADRYGAALRLLGHDDRRRSELLASLASALTAAGRLEPARAAMDECLALLGSADGARRAELAATMATVEGLLGAYAAADGRLAAALDDAPADARPRLLLSRAGGAFLRGDAEGLVRWTAQAEAELDPGADPITRARLDATLALALALRGEPAGPRMERAVALLAATGDDALAREIDAVWTVGGTLVMLERYRDAAEAIERGIRVARATRRGHVLLHLHTLASLCRLALLDLAAALEHAEAAEEMARLEGLSFQLAFALSQRARILAAGGDPVAAERAAAESDALLEAGDRAGTTATLLAHNAIVRRAADPAALLDELATIAGFGGERLNRTVVAGVAVAAVRAAVLVERFDEAEAWVAAAERAATTAGVDDAPLPASAARAGRARAELRLGRGDARAAAGEAAAVADAAQRAGLRGDALEARLLEGRARAAAGDRDEAVRILREVAEAAAAHGALSLRDAAARDLRRHGAHVPTGARRATSGGEPLTDREREIAELVAGGATNKQVAAALFVSDKTVERHLSNVYAKLGVRSRTELAATLARG